MLNIFVRDDSVQHFPTHVIWTRSPIHDDFVPYQSDDGDSISHSLAFGNVMMPARTGLFHFHDFLSFFWPVGETFVPAIGNDDSVCPKPVDG